LFSGRPAIASGRDDGDVARSTPNPSSMAKSAVFRKSEIDPSLKSLDTKTKSLTNGQAGSFRNKTQTT
jgi:hypothetical protein